MHCPLCKNTILEKKSKSYIVKGSVHVLKSTSKNVIDTWSVPGGPYQTQGGGIQYFTTNKNMLLEVN